MAALLDQQQKQGLLERWYSNKMRGQRGKRAAEESQAAGNAVEVIDVFDFPVTTLSRGTAVSRVAATPLTRDSRGDVEPVLKYENG